MADRRPRDLELLDKVDALPRTPYEGTAWRIAREGRDPLQGYPAAGAVGSRHVRRDLHVTRARGIAC